MSDRTLLVTLAVFLAQCLVLSGAGVAAQIWRRRLTGRGSTATEALLLGALAPAALGYLAFWLYFAVTASAALLIAALSATSLFPPRTPVSST